MSRLLRGGRRITAKLVARARRAVASFAADPPPPPELFRRASTEALDSRVCIVTGSSRGIGKAVAAAFAAAGAHVVVNGRDPKTVDATVREITAGGGSAIGVAADVATEEGVRRLVEETIRAYGAIDVLVNNAAVARAPGTELWAASSEDVTESLRANVLGPFLCARAVIAWMKAQQRAGRIINVSSGAGTRAFAGLGVYGISKFALEGLGQYLTADLGRTGIAVVTLQLGSLRTRMTQGWLSWEEHAVLPEPETVAPAFLYAATAPADEVHGRVLAAPRLLAAPEAETLLAGPMATASDIVYAPLRMKGVEVPRDWRRLTLHDRAENPYGPSPKVAEAIAAAVRERPVSYYPDERYARLTEALSQELGLPAECFAIGNGSWALLDEILRLFVKPGEEVVSNLPGWFGFHMLCPRYGIDNKRVPMLLNGSSNRPHHNLAGVLEAIGPRTRLVYLVSPSNPEAIALSESEFAEFLAEVPAHLPIVIDEAYVEYADSPELVRTAVHAQRRDRTVIGLRTFSKFFGLGGMRVGYAFSRPEIAKLIRRQSLIFNVSYLSEVAAVAALGDADHRRLVFESMRAERRRVAEELAALGLASIPSQSCFVMIEAPCPVAKYVERFSDEGIFVAPYEFYGGEYVMFPIGTAPQNDRNIEILRSLV